MLGMISLAAVSACLVTIDSELIGVFPDAGVDAALDAACVRVSSDAGPVVIVSGLEGAEHIAVDPGACGQGLVFWTAGSCGSDGGVFAASKDGGQSRSIASGSCHVTTSASHVAWAGYTFVGIAQLDAGSPQKIAAAAGVYHVAVQGGFVFWADTYGPGIYRARTEDVSCESCRIIETASGAFSIAADDSSVYWTEVDSYNGQSTPDASVHAANLDGSNV